MIEDERLLDYILPNTKPMIRDAAAEPFHAAATLSTYITLLTTTVWIATILALTVHLGVRTLLALPWLTLPLLVLVGYVVSLTRKAHQ